MYVHRCVALLFRTEIHMIPTAPGTLLALAVYHKSLRARPHQNLSYDAVPRRDAVQALPEQEIPTAEAALAEFPGLGFGE